MEFPDLGQNCSFAICNKLDFLPMKCDACEEVFCHEHFSYQNHKCHSAYKKNVQVPVCPLCNKPIPVSKGEQPDIVVGAHIDSDCQSDPAKSRRKVFTNKCSLKGCKQKEVVPIICNDCQKTYCIRHRHPQDHQCAGPQKASSKAAEAAVSRQKQTVGHAAKVPSSKTAPPGAKFRGATSKTSVQPQATAIQAATRVAVQGNMSEDEALARALQASLQDTPGNTNQHSPQGMPVLSQEEEDLMLARAIAESEREQRRMQQVPGNSGSSRDRCSVS